MGKKVRIPTTLQPLTFEGLIKRMPALVDRLPNELLRKTIEFSINIRAGVAPCKSCRWEEKNEEHVPSLARLDASQLGSLTHHQGESNTAQIPCRGYMWLTVASMLLASESDFGFKWQAKVGGLPCVSSPSLCASLVQPCIQGRCYQAPRTSRIGSVQLHDIPGSHVYFNVKHLKDVPGGYTTRFLAPKNLVPNL